MLQADLVTLAIADFPLTDLNLQNPCPGVKDEIQVSFKDLKGKEVSVFRSTARIEQ